MNQRKWEPEAVANRGALSAALLLTLWLLGACSMTPAPTTAEPTLLAYEAERADIYNGVFVMINDESASAQAALMQPASVASNAAPTEDAFIDIELPHEGNWTLWSRISSGRFVEGSIYIGVAGQLAAVATASDHYVWRPVMSVGLSSGHHRISLGHATSETRIDLLVVTNQELSAGDLETWRATNSTPAAPISPVEPQPLGNGDG